MTNALNATDYEIGQRFTSVNALEGQAFAIINEADGNKVLYGTDNQNLGYDVFSAAFVDTNTGYLFKLESSTIAGCYLLRLQTPTGTGYSIWGGPGYLNTQPTDKWCSFIAPLGTQNGTDIENGAVWEIQYVENKGFTLLNKGTNLYLTSNAPAKYETPVYFTFCTLKASTPEPAVGDVIAEGKYYLYNVAAQGFIVGANNWGTRASIAKTGGVEFEAVLADGKYELKSAPLYIGKHLGFNGYVDNADLSNWTIAPAEGQEGVFTLSTNDGKVLFWDGGNATTTSVGAMPETVANAYWQFISPAERLAAFAAATAQNPVDATFLIQNPNFSREASSSVWTMVADNMNLCGGTNENKCAESWHSTFTLSQVIGNAPKGLYALTAQGFFSPADAGGSKPVFYANEETVTFPAKTGSEDDMDKASNSFLSGLYVCDPIFVKVTENGALTVGAKLEGNTALWCIWDNFQLTYYGEGTDIEDVKNAAIIKELVDLREKATELKEQVEVASIKTALEEALAATAEVSGAEAINTAITTMKTAVESAETSLSAKEKLAKMSELIAATNIYTAEAYEEYYNQWVVKYQDGSLTKEEEAALQNPFLLTDWHASITCDNFLLSAWDTTPDFQDAPYYINSWSVEGETDGSNFMVPFFEYWTDDANSLGERTLTATMNGIEAGDYDVTALVRVRTKDETGTDVKAYGITLSANEGEATDVTKGAKKIAINKNNNFYLQKFTAVGTVGEDGVLKIQFKVAADNNISWLSFKNVKYAKHHSEPLEADLVEIPQDQGVSLDDYARTELVEGEEYNTYTATADLMVAFKMYDIDVKDCDYVVVKFAEPVAAGWNIAFWAQGGIDNVAIPEGATEYKYVFAEDNKCAIQNDILPQISMLTLWGGQKPLIAKVTGVYKHHKVTPVPVDEEFVAAKAEYESALAAAKAALIDEDYAVVTGAEKTTLANVVVSYESIANPTTEIYNTATAALIVTTKMFMGAKILYDVQTIYQAYSISGVRYWFDSNYTTPQEIAYQAGEVTFDVSALSDGFHTLHYQVVDNHGGLSPVCTSSFFRVSASNDGVSADYTIASVRYWYDSDESPQTTSYSAGSMTFDASALSDGFHTLHYQVVDNHGGLSPVRTSSFFRVPASNDGVNAVYTIASVRYWFDSADSPQSTTYNAGATSFDASALSDGFHTLHYQIVDNRGGLSPTRTSSFMRIASASEVITTDYEVTGIRYWFDQDAANAKTGTYVSGICSVDASALEAGAHTLHYQVLTSDGNVSPVRSSSFTLTSVIVLNENNDFALLADIEDADVQLNLSVESQVWDAVILPFSLTNQQVKDLFGQNALVAVLEGESNGKMLFHSSYDGIEANQPFLLRPDVTASSFIVNGIRLCKSIETIVDVGNHVMAGNYHASVTMSTGSYLYINGELTASNGSYSLKSFHALLYSKNGGGFDIEVDETDPKRIDLADWQVLKSVYENNGGEDWTRQWTFGDAPTSSRDLPGIRVADGKVTYIDLSDNGLVGSFPITLLSLPSLQELNLSTNQLSGSLHQILASCQQTNSNFTSSVRTLNISHNQLSGNIGTLAQCCPQLQSLNAGYNQLESVTPVISEQVTTLDLSHQTIQNAVDLSLSELTAESMIEKTPNILRYNHPSQSYDSNARWLLTTSADNWSLMFSSLSGELAMPWVSAQNAYHGASGEVLNVALVDANRQPLGGTFPLSLSFDAGDGNFDGQVDVLDLQTAINFIFNDYKSKPFNFTATNLWVDEQINVQDIVRLVDALMAQGIDDQPAGARSVSKPVGEEAEAYVTCRNGMLYLITSCPVAAFDIILSGETNIRLASALLQQGFTCVVKKVSGGVRIIGYSLAGSTLPAGESVLGESGHAVVSRAILSDANAEYILVNTENETSGITDVNVMSRTKEVYRLRIGRNRAVVIDADGNKSFDIKK